MDVNTVNEKEYGMSRDALYEKLKQNDIFVRRYFYPLISDFPVYRDLPSFLLNGCLWHAKCQGRLFVYRFMPDWR